MGSDTNDRFASDEEGAPPLNRQGQEGSGEGHAGEERGYRADAPVGPDDGESFGSGGLGPGEPTGARDGWNGAGTQRSPETDAEYESWRERQMEAFDRDYEAFRKAHQGQPDAAFAAWRQARET